MNKRQREISKTQKNWRKYYDKHPNTDIYYQARHPQYREEYYNQSTSASGRIGHFIKKVLRKIVIALIIIYILAILASVGKSKEIKIIIETQEQETTSNAE